MRRLFSKLNKNKAGFSMAEMLMVVAILAILAALGVGGVTGFRQKLKLTEYDKNAEIIFEAAQRSMVDILAFDKDSFDILTAHEADGSPLYASGLVDTGVSYGTPVGTGTDPLYNKRYYLRIAPGDMEATPADETAANRQKAAKAILYGQVDDSLLNKGWIIEYTPSSLQVNSVYYYEDKQESEDFYDTVADSLRKKENRLTYARSKNGIFVGYFDGATSSAEAVDEKLIVAIKQPTNAETLSTTVSVLTDVEPDYEDGSCELTINTIGEESGARLTQKISVPSYLFSGPDFSTGFYQADFTFTIDSLENPFYTTYGNLEKMGNYFNSASFFSTRAPGLMSQYMLGVTTSDKSFAPGENIIISAEVTKDGNKASHNGRTVNSLFASGSKVFENGLYPVEISCGRHLQNLDRVTSGFDVQRVWNGNGSVTGVKVTQTGDISFADDTEATGEWAEVYNGRTFVPITNDQIQKFVTAADDTGAYYTIDAMEVDMDPSYTWSQYDANGIMGSVTLADIIEQKADINRYRAGLFSTFHGSELTGIHLAGETVTGTGLASVGGLAGALRPTVSNNVSITDCQMYMLPANYTNQMADAEKEPQKVMTEWMNGLGSTVMDDSRLAMGGLIGEAAVFLRDGSQVVPEIFFNGSSASTVLNAHRNQSSNTANDTYAGGLVGYADGTVRVLRSYADCYITADHIGGLCGAAGVSSTFEISYSAGFAYGFDGVDEVAGITPSPVTSLDNVYSIFQTGTEDDYGAGLADLKSSYTVTSAGSVSNVYYFTDLLAGSASVGTKAEIEDIQYGEMTDPDNEKNTIRMFDDSKTVSVDGADVTYGVFVYPIEQNKDSRPVSAAYNLSKCMNGVKQYLDPMIATDAAAGKAIPHYGDWLDLAAKHTVNFYYSDEAKAVDASADEKTGYAQTSKGTADAVLYLPDNSVKYPVGNTYYFAEDKGTSVVGSYHGGQQKVQHDTNVYIPQQSFTVKGRERMVLYWEYLYKGTRYWYVPSDEDTDYDNYTKDGTHYYGVIYYCDDKPNPFVKGVRTYATYNKDRDTYLEYDNENKTSTTIEIKNPFEYVRSDINAYAHFYQSDKLKYVRLNYRLVPSKGEAIPRYLGKKRVYAVENGTDSDGNPQYDYYIDYQAKRNVGGYHFSGWYADPEKSNRQAMETVELTFGSVTKSLVKLNDAVIKNGSIYAIYEELEPYTIYTEFYLHGGGDNPWGVSIASPSVDNYTQNDLEDSNGNPTETRKIYLPDLSESTGGTGGGYSLYTKTDGKAYADFYPDVKKEPTESYEIHTDDKGAYIEESITEDKADGTYLVNYVSDAQREYRVKQIYENTNNDTNFSYNDNKNTEVKVEYMPSDVKTYTGIVGHEIGTDDINNNGTIASSFDPIGGAGFEVDYDNPKMSSPVLPKGNTVYECKVYYKRKVIPLYYDLNGGSYVDTADSSKTRIGYRVADDVVYGAPIKTAAFIDKVETGTNTAGTSGYVMRKTGESFQKWIVFDYEYYTKHYKDCMDAVNKNNLSSISEKYYYDIAEPMCGLQDTDKHNGVKPMIAVAMWALDANISVRLEIYRQDRTDDIKFSADEKHYQLAKQADITELISNVITKNMGKGAIKRVKEALYNDNDGVADTQSDLYTQIKNIYEWNNYYYENDNSYTHLSSEKQADADAIYNLMTSSETANYFKFAEDDDDRTSGSTDKVWVRIRPVIEDGVLVCRLYYDRRIVKIVTEYKNSNTNYFYRDEPNGDTFKKGGQYYQACKDIMDAIDKEKKYGSDYIEVKYEYWNNRTFTQDSSVKKFKSATITTSVLYGSDYNSSYQVWTDVISWSIGDSLQSTLPSYIDENNSMGSTTWRFKFREYCVTNNIVVKIFADTDDTKKTEKQIPKTYDGSEKATYHFDLSEPIMTEYYNNDSGRIFYPHGFFYGYRVIGYQMANNDQTIKYLEEGKENSLTDKNSFSPSNYATYNVYLVREKNNIQYNGVSGLDSKIGVPYSTVLTSDENVRTYFPVHLPNKPFGHLTNEGNYTFKGWYSTSEYEDGSLIVDENGNVKRSVVMDNRDMQFFARWEPKKYTITYDPSYESYIDANGEKQQEKVDDSEKQLFKQEVSFGLSVNDMDLELIDMTNDDIQNTSGFLSKEDGKVYYTIPKEFTGEELDTKYEFMGWWHSGKSIQFSPGEPIYGDTTVEGKWKKTYGTTELTIKMAKVVNEKVESVVPYKEKVTVPLGKETYVYAPLKTNWEGFYPTTTRVKKTFTEENPEIIFYYTKGDSLSFTTQYYVTVNPYNSNSGEVSLQELFSSQNVVSPTTSYTVIPKNYTGFKLEGSESAIKIDKTTLISKYPDGIIKFYYTPDVDDLELDVYEGFGDGDESYPSINYGGVPVGEALLASKEVFNLKDKDNNAITGYSYASMYRIYNRKGTRIFVDGVWKRKAEVKDSEGWMTETEFHTNCLNDNTYMLEPGIYKAEGKLMLFYKGNDSNRGNITMWESDGKISFRIAEAEDDE